VDAPDGALGGIVAWYSIIHTPPEELPVVFAELRRVLAPGGHLLLAFQVGDEPRHLAQALGHVVSLDFYRFQPDQVAQLLGDAGLALFAQLLREPDETERVQQAYVLARKPTPIGDANDVR
jgi:SAM-dependent methyltransferase